MGSYCLIDAFELVWFFLLSVYVIVEDICFLFYGYGVGSCAVRLIKISLFFDWILRDMFDVGCFLFLLGEGGYIYMMNVLF